MDLVGESLGGELVGEFAAAEGDQVPAVLALEAGHALGEVAPLINDAFHSKGSSKVREATYLGMLFPARRSRCRR